MARRKTVTELEASLKILEAYREAYFCLRKGMPVKTFASGEWSVEVIGMTRASGGVVVAVNGDPCCCQYVEELILLWQKSVDAYQRDIASQIASQLMRAWKAHYEEG